MATRLPLTKLAPALAAEGYGPTTYRHLYLAALDGRIPATQDDRGRWGADVSDLPAIAQAMGLSEAVAA